DSNKAAYARSEERMKARERATDGDGPYHTCVKRQLDRVEVTKQVAGLSGDADLRKWDGLAGRELRLHAKVTEVCETVGRPAAATGEGTHRRTNRHDGGRPDRAEGGHMPLLPIREDRMTGAASEERDHHDRAPPDTAR